MYSDPPSKAPDRIWSALFWVSAGALLFLFVPIGLLSTQNFINADDVGLFNLVRERGWVATTQWFVEYSMVRPTFIGIYSALADLSLAMGFSTRAWLKMSVAVDYAMMLIAAAWLIRVLMPRIPVALAATGALMLVLGTLVSTQNVTPPLSNLLLGWVVANYSPAFAFYCATLAVLVLVLGPARKRARLFLPLVIVFLLYIGAHEVNVVGGFVVLLIVALLSVPVHRMPSAGSRLERLLAWRIRFALADRFVVGAAVFLSLFVGWFVYLHLFTSSFDNRASYTNQVSPIDAAGRAVGDIVTTLPSTYLVGSSFLLVFFVFMFLAARRYGVHRHLVGQRRLFLLMPLFVLLATALSLFAGSYMQTGTLQPRLLNYGGQHLAITLLGLALFIGTSKWVTARRFLATRPLMLVLVSLFAVTIWQNPIYGQMYDVATGIGYKFSKSLDRREDLLLLNAGKVIRFPTFHLLASHTGGTQIPWAPMVGMPPMGSMVDNYKVGLSKIYGLEGVEIVDCEKVGHLPECFYVQVP